MEVHVLPCCEFLVKALILENDPDGLPDPVLILLDIDTAHCCSSFDRFEEVASIESEVVLPTPFGPSRPKIFPGPIVNEMSVTATSSLNFRVR